MLEIVLDILIILGLNRLLGRLDTSAWKSKLVVIILLGLAATLSIVVMAASMVAGVWGLGIPALVASLLFGFWTVKFLLCWIRGDCSGSGSLLLDAKLIPEGDLTVKLTEEEKLRGEMDDRCRCLDKRMW